MKYLLDTNIVSALMKDPAGPVFRRMRDVAESSICTSIVVLAEIKYGIRKSGSRRLASQFESIKSGLIIEPLAEPVEEHYATIRNETESIGLTVSQNDLLIAAQTLALDAVLVTDDRIFLTVPKLKVENWLR